MSFDVTSFGRGRTPELPENRKTETLEYETMEPNYTGFQLLFSTLDNGIGYVM